MNPVLRAAGHFILRMIGFLMGVVMFAVATVLASISGNGLAAFISVCGMLIALLGAFEVHIHDAHLRVVREQLDLADRRTDQARAEARQLRQTRTERY